MGAYLLVGSVSQVCAEVLVLRQLADGGSRPGRVWYLQHRLTRRAELPEAALEVLVQVAVKDRVQTAADEESVFDPQFFANNQMVRLTKVIEIC